MKLVTVEEMRAIEDEMNGRGLPYSEMMQNAGSLLASVIMKRYSERKSMAAVGLVGGGNNGGDTLIALTKMQQEGWNSIVLLAKERPNDSLVKILEDAGGKILTASERGFYGSLHSILSLAGLVIDGISGTGVSLPLKDDVSKLLKAVGENLDSQIVIAVDCPSGVDCVTGQAAAETLTADLTVCMEAVKAGLLCFPAFKYCGEIVTVPVGLEKAITKEQSARLVVDDLWVREHIPSRPMDAHKGTFGSVMVLGGSLNYVGAPMLAGMAAYRTGSGLVMLAVPQSIQGMIAGQLPEAVWLVLAEEGGVISELAAETAKQSFSRVDALVVGPGIGREDTTKRFLDQVLLGGKPNGKSRRVGFLETEAEGVAATDRIPPVVLDADGLRWLAEREGWVEKIQTRLVLTPHPGEMAALTGLTVDEIQEDRQGIARHYAKLWNQVLILKGALTVITSPDGREAIIPLASSALAKAGSGDVLSGMVASLIGQGVQCYEAACAAAWIHANAGICAAACVQSSAAVLSRDIIAAIPTVLTDLNKNTALH
jgi:ADP-dependent NAD(P)H-hydrate dehydratase / NAD(P)H-hydrate epimerase